MKNIRVAAIVPDDLVFHLVESAYSMYFGLTVERFRDFADFLKKGTEFNLVLVDGSKSKLQLVPQARAHQDKDKNLNLMILGLTGKDEERVGYASGADLILKMTRQTARLYKITAEELSKIQNEQMYRIPVSLIVRGTKSISPLYAPVGKEGSFQLLEEGDVVNDRFFELLTLNKTEHALVPAKYRVKFFAKICERYKGKLIQLVGTEEVHSKASELQDYLVQQFKIEPLNEQALDMSREIIATTLENSKQVTGVAQLVERLFKQKNSLRYKMTSLTTYFASIIIDNSEFGNEKQKEIIGYAALFQDMFLETDDQVRVSNSTQLRKITDEREHRLVDLHAKLAGRYFEGISGVPDGVPNVLREHHGAHDGQGFDPKKLQLTHLSIVFAVAEYWAKSLLLIGEAPNERNIFRALDMTRNKFEHLSPFARVIKSIDAKSLKGEAKAA